MGRLSKLFSHSTSEWDLKGGIFTKVRLAPEDMLRAMCLYRS